MKEHMEMKSQENKHRFWKLKSGTFLKPKQKGSQNNKQLQQISLIAPTSLLGSCSKETSSALK